MVKRWWTTATRWSVVPLAAATVLSVAAAAPAAAAPVVAKPAEQAEATMATMATMEVLKPAAFAVSEPVTELAKRAAATGGVAVKAPRPEETGPAVRDNGFQGEAATAPDRAAIDVAAPAPSLTFTGITNACGGCSPPDIVGDVGPSHYVQMVNVHFGVWNKAGAVLVPTTPIATLFAPIPNCNIGYGDPIVLHDQIANRWILTQFTAAAPFLLCIAVSQTADPTGAYFLYAFNSTNFADYPKYGVWPNALYGSTREFNAAGAFVGVGAYAFDKAVMYAGGAATAIKFLVPPGATPFQIGDGLLPADLDGRNLPPAGAPNPYVGTMDNGGPYAAPADALNLFHFSLTTFAPPVASFTFIKQINVAAFDSIFPCAPGPRDCIPQAGTAQKVDILSYRQRPMHRLAYRNFLSYDTLFTNQSIESAANIAGVRWWELRSPLSAAASAIFQQGTVPGTAAIHRWMGSVAQDKNGNAALGYSVSGPNLFPGIRYVGRLAGDALNTMPLTERVLFSGTGSQQGSPRWGDYTSMNIDPADDCTFWYTNEYYTAANNLTTNWSTRIGRFRFPNC